MAALRIFLLLVVLAAPLLLGDVGLITSAGIVLCHVIFDRDSRSATFSARWRGVTPSILLGATFGTAISVGMFLIVDPWLAGFTGQTVDLSSFAAVEGNLSAYLQLLLIGLIVGGIFEEVVFRGYLIGWGSKALAPIPAVLLAALSASVFGLAHAYQGPTGMISTGIIGFCFGLLYIAVGRKLLVPVAAHMTVNIIGITALYLGIGL